MTMVLALAWLWSGAAHAEELRFRGTLVEDGGFWRTGHVTLAEHAVVVRTRTFPFHVETEGFDLGRYTGDFHVSHGLFRGRVTVPTLREGPVVFRCSARQARRVAEELETRLTEAPSVSRRPSAAR